jgi:hypothetical protein
MLTPSKKPAGGKLTAWQKEYNGQINKIRWIVEQIIANLPSIPLQNRRPLRHSCALARSAPV